VRSVFAPIAEMPMADTQMEDAIFVLAGHVFLKTSDYLLCLEGTCIVTLGVKTASIRVAREADKIIVEIQDQGRGMSAEKLAKIQSQGSGVGSVECESACVTLVESYFSNRTAKAQKLLPLFPQRRFRRRSKSS
jgi:hypothetical protein